MSQDKVDKIYDILKENSNVISFIKSYILLSRIPQIALSSLKYSVIGNTSTNKCIEKYSQKTNKITEIYNKEIKDKCDKDYVKSMCENGKLSQLKSEIDIINTRNLNSIISHYKKTEGYGNTSGKISDFCLYSEYLSMLTSDDFVYDDENPYVVELFYKINYYLQIRERLENNTQNIAGLIDEFDNYCRNTLKGIWTDPNTSYYSKIKDIFKYDFYTADENQLIESKIDGKDRVTLYSKVLKYLENITNIQKYQDTSYKYTETDIQSIINGEFKESTENNNEENEFRKKLKKIAINFVVIRKIETTPTNNYISNFISKYELEKVFDAEQFLNKIGIDYRDFNDTLEINPSLLAYKAPLKKYLGALKDITETEAKELNDLCNKAISWYTNNNESINNGTIFNDLKEISWGEKTTIYHNGIPHDFYYLEKGNSFDENNIENDFENNITYNYTSNSLLTKHGIDSLSYWMKYCTIATLVGCTLPTTWATGLIIAGKTIKLPILYIPIFVISGKLLTVIGLGICGICPYPMILYMNLTDEPLSIISSTNLITDTTRKIVAMIMNQQKTVIKNIIKSSIKTLDDKITKINDEISDIDKEILNINNGVKIDNDILKNLKNIKK